jgi:aldehyde dehydrogenase (NAD+)
MKLLTEWPQEKARVQANLALLQTMVDEAIRMANDSPYALGATFWSQDPKKLFYAARKIDAGIVWLNTNVMSKIEAPYGGNKNSGLGREDGTVGLKEYLKVKNNVLFIAKDYDNFYNFKD